MPTLTNLNPPVYKQFFSPVFSLDPLDSTRKCPALSDCDWLQCGILRATQAVASGRDFLQQIGARMEGELECSHYFETLKSPRRLNYITQAAGAVVEQMQDQLPDRLAGVEGLENFQVFAGDGHWHEHATHDPSKPRASNGGATWTKYATGHLYGIDLRRGALVHLTHCDELSRRKEHDMRALKRLDAAMLRQGAARGKKTLWVWDRAGIDFGQWHKWKQTQGVYFASRAKSNMNLDEIAPLPWERNDPLNTGVEQNGIVMGGPQSMIRYICYRDPLSEEVFEFVTNEMKLAPGVIVQLYRMRWDIEKAFDDFKNKLGEQKAWAKSSTAKTMQAQFLCLAHNLMTLHEAYLQREHDIVNVAENRRRDQRLAKEVLKAKEKGRKLPSLYIDLCRTTQIPLKFIRWLRIHLFEATSWAAAEASLRRRYARL